MGKSSKKSGDSDPRFSTSLYDPRFNVPSLRRNKVKVDERFSKEELKKLNVTATGRLVKVDRYGRKIKKDANEDYEKYFEEEKSESESESGSLSESEDEESKEQSAKEDKSGSESGSESEEEEEEEEEETDKKKIAKEKLAKPKRVVGSASEESSAELESDSDSESAFVDRARGEGLQSDSSDSESDSEDEESGSEEEVEEKPEEGDPSSTFAVVNLDWDNVRAVDLMATFASFVPKGGSIRSVAIYPSEFGKEQMQKEEVEGPPKELFRSKKKTSKDLDSDSDDDLDLTNKEDLEKAARKLYEEDDGEQDYDSKALRRYQLQRLRYFYAVVQCDSVETAQNIYNNCDGSEYESTANVFDLRYVPQGMDFDESDIKDKCTKIPASYRPDSTFVTDALQHSKVKLTWDETPKERLTLSSRLFSQKEIDDMDFKAYLASDSDGSDNENDQLKDKYKSLLGGKFTFGKDDEEDDVDMEITFNPGLDESKPEPPKKQEEEEEEESTIAAYKRKEKERRARRQEKFNSKVEEEKEKEKEKSEEKPGKKKNKKHQKTAADEKSKAQLELLLLDEENDNNADHFSMRDIVKAEKQKSKKGKKGKKNFDDTLVQDSFTPDLNDPRFKEVFENHEYAIDPTSSEFKKTETMKEILKERSKRLRSESGQKKSKKAKVQSGSALDSLVEKMKRKSQHK